MNPQNPHQTEDAVEADDLGEKPDLGRKPDALAESLTGSDMGSDTRAGSLQGGSASGSDDDPDQEAINEALATEGMSSAAPRQPVDPDPVKNTGADNSLAGREGDLADGKPKVKPKGGPGGDDVDAATG